MIVHDIANDRCISFTSLQECIEWIYCQLPDDEKSDSWNNVSTWYCIQTDDQNCVCHRQGISGYDIATCWQELVTSMLS
jgi:hypothetical protein